MIRSVSSCLPLAAPVAPLAALELAVDERRIERDARRKAFDDRGEGRPVRFAGGQVSEHGMREPARDWSFPRKRAARSVSRTPRRTCTRVFSTTSSGRRGGGLALSQPVVSSQSRTNCLSNDGCGPPGRYDSIDQYRELSGVSTSSTSSSSPVSSSNPHSNLVSARISPRSRRVCRGDPIDLQAHRL